jgi:hypothetical protein
MQFWRFEICLFSFFASHEPIIPLGSELLFSRFRDTMLFFSEPVARFGQG